MGVYRLYFFYLQPKSMITLKMWEKAIVSDSHGLERGCDLIPHINLFTTIHDGNFRRHSSMNVTIK